MKNFKNLIVVAAALTFIVAAPLSGCGKKGHPNPPRKNKVYPTVYPKGALRFDAAPNHLQFSFKVNRDQ
jgi:hypothetical protein